MLKSFLVDSKNIEDRLDPEFYQPKYSSLRKSLTENGAEKLGSIIRFSSEIWDQKRYFNGVFPYIEISKINTNTGEIEEIKKIKKINAPSRAKKIVRKEDILISTTRPHRGAITLIDEKHDFHIASTGFSVIRELKNNAPVSRPFLYLMLRQSFCLQQMKQRSSGGNYPAITEEELKKVLIPILPSEQQKQITSLFEDAHRAKAQKETEAEKLLNSIDDYLLSELGIELPEKDNSLGNRIFRASFQNVSAMRLDPDYYAKYYKELEKSIDDSKFKTKEIGSLALFLKGGKTPASSEYSNDKKTDYPIIKVGSYTSNNINLDKAGYTNSENNSIKARKSDIFILSAAHQAEYVGKHIKILMEEPRVPTSYVGELINIRANKSICNPIYLFSVLNLKLFKTLINREKTGQTSHVYGKDLQYIRVPAPPIEKQNKIANHIKQLRSKAKQLKKEARQEAENARRQVEDMILEEESNDN